MTSLTSSQTTEVTKFPTHYVDYMLTRILPHISHNSGEVNTAGEPPASSPSSSSRLSTIASSAKNMGAVAAATSESICTAAKSGDTTTIITSATTGLEPDIPALSISIIASSLIKINARTKGLGVLHGYIVRFFSWENPALTLSILIVYTYICFYPYLIVGLPGFGLLFGVMAPGFVRRHPFSRQLLPRMRPRINDYDDVLYESWPPPYVHDNYNFDSEDQSGSGGSGTYGSGSSALGSSCDSWADIIDTTIPLRLRPSRISQPSKAVLTSVRELQSSLSKFAQVLDDLDTFFYGPASFVGDERQGAAIFVLVFFGTIAVVYSASFLSLSVTAAVGGWAITLMAHPDIHRNAKDFQEAYLSGQEEALEEFIAKYQDFDIDSYHDIMDGSVEEIRDVEIFELQRQGLTPRMWDRWVYTPLIYSERSAYRQSENRPPGASFLREIQPPPGWFFDTTQPWVLDTNAKAWVMDRAARDVEIDVDDHWAYDYKNGERGEWRRRRWTRPCFRKALPARRKK